MTSASLKKISENIPVCDKVEVTRIIDECCANLPPEIDTNKFVEFIDIIQEIYKNDFKYEPLQKTETQIISEIWNRICAPVNAPNRRNMLEIFIKQILDCKDGAIDNERVPLVCQTGRVSRYLQTLECTDAEIDAKIVDTQLVQKEIYDKIGAIVLENEKLETPKTSEQLKLEIPDIIRADYPKLEDRIITPPIEIALSALQ